MATPATVMGVSPSAAERRVAWLCDGVACLYFGWLYFVLVRHASAFGGALEGLGGEIPPLTTFLVRHFWWAYAVVLGSAGAFVVLKERWFADKRASAALTFTVALVVQAILDYCREALSYPMIDIMQKLS